MYEPRSLVAEQFTLGLAQSAGAVTGRLASSLWEPEFIVQPAFLTEVRDRVALLSSVVQDAGGAPSTFKTSSRSNYLPISKCHAIGN